MSLNKILSGDTGATVLTKINGNLDKQVTGVTYASGVLSLNNLDGSSFTTEIPYPADGVIEGMAINPGISTLIWVVDPGTYVIGGNVYTTLGDSYTIPVGDPTDPRYDVIYFDGTGISGITGTAAATPTIPALAAGQIAVGYLYVNANATGGTGDVILVGDANSTPVTGDANGIAYFDAGGNIKSDSTKMSYNEGTGELLLNVAGSLILQSSSFIDIYTPNDNITIGTDVASGTIAINANNGGYINLSSNGGSNGIFTYDNVGGLTGAGMYAEDGLINANIDLISYGTDNVGILINTTEGTDNTYIKLNSDGPKSTNLYTEVHTDNDMFLYASKDMSIEASGISIITFGSSLNLNTNNIKVTSNKTAGNVQLTGGTVTVANTSITANSIIMLTVKTIGGTPGTLSYTLNAGVGFTINSSSGTDTSTISWFKVDII